MSTIKYFILLILSTILVYSTVGHLTAAIASEKNSQRELTVDQAYKSVPHRRTQYSATKSTQSKPVTHYLSTLFQATDLALIERVNGLQGSFDNTRYQNRINQLMEITPPKQSKAAHQLIINAVTEHKLYFSGAKRDRSLIRSSHSKLVRAYQMLMREYPDSAVNQQAYFDHLCALDFI